MSTLVWTKKMTLLLKSSVGFWVYIRRILSIIRWGWGKERYEAVHLESEFQSGRVTQLNSLNCLTHSWMNNGKSHVNSKTKDKPIPRYKRLTLTLSCSSPCTTAPLIRKRTHQKNRNIPYVIVWTYAYAAWAFTYCEK